MDVPAQNTKHLPRQVYIRAFEYEQKYGNCPQCVLAAIQDAFEIVDNRVFMAAHGLAGGVGLATDGTCGALAGGVMALCCRYGRARENFGKGRYLVSYELAKRLHDRFVQEYGSCICREVQNRLFGRSFDLWDRKEYDDFEKAGGHTSKCPGVVGNVAMWVAEMLEVEDNTRRSTSSESMT